MEVVSKKHRALKGLMNGYKRTSFKVIKFTICNKILNSSSCHRELLDLIKEKSMILLHAWPFNHQGSPALNL